jgi:putative ABC transport system permease protein
MNKKMNYVTFIVAGIRNKPGRNLATVFCFAFIAANIFSGQFLLSGAVGGVERGISRMGADHIVVPVQYLITTGYSGGASTGAIVSVNPSVFRVNKSIMDIIGNVSGVAETSPQLYVSTLELPELSSSPVSIFGIDPESDFTIQPWLQQPLGAPLKRGEVIIGKDIDGEILSPILVKNHTYTVAGRLDPTQSAADTTIYMGLDDAYVLTAAEGIVPRTGPRILPGDINAVLVRDLPGENPDTVGSRIKKAFSFSNSAGNFAVINRHFTLAPVSRDIQDIPSLLLIISAFVVIAALPLIALISAMVAHERHREIGLLKAMGAQRRVIFFLVIAESLVLAVIGGIIGVVVSLIVFSLLNLQGLLNGALQVSFRIPTPADTSLMAGLALFAVIVIGSISSLWPAYRTSTMNPYDAIRQEIQ